MTHRSRLLMENSHRRLSEHPSPRRWLWKQKRYARLLKRELARLKQECAVLRDEAGIPDNHVDFGLNVDGQVYQVLGDPNMSEETRKALAEVIRAAIRWMDSGESEGEDE